MRYWLKVVNSPRTWRYVVIDETGRTYCEFIGGRELKISDAEGTELGSLRCVDEHYFVRPYYELQRGEGDLSKIELAFRKLTVASSDGSRTVIARDGLKRIRHCVRDRSAVGEILRRRFQGKRTYEVNLAEDVDPIPIMSAAIAIDQCRRLKWHNIFALIFAPAPG